MTQASTGQTRNTLLVNQSDATGITRWNDFCQLTKLRLSLMVVLTAFLGFAMGVRNPEAQPWSWILLAATLAGVSLSCMGASVFNQIYERDTDALMRRTKDRPLPAGRASVSTAIVLACLLSLAGITLLAAVANPLAASLAAFTIASYVLVYTPLKRVSSTSTIVGAVPGALPPVMGYAAATGTIRIEAWLMFAILFLWQLPHFLAIAWLYRDEYARAGMAMLPVVDPDGHSTFRQILLGCMALVPVGLLPSMMGVSGVVYFFGSLTAGVVFLAFGVALEITRSRRHARAMFFASLVYLPLVYGLMLIDHL